MAFMDKLKVLWGKAFVGGEWKVAYRKIGSKQNYTFVDVPTGTWIADPFIYEANGVHYLFVELFEKEKNKACIGYYRFIDGNPVFQGKIIEQPYHMSYPCIFEYDGEHYMIPESSAGSTVDLYRAIQFPDQWVLDTTFLTDVKYVDTTVVKLDNDFYAFAYGKEGREWRLKLFALDMKQRTFQRIAEKAYETNIGRPAGYFLYDGILKRPAQDCSRKYGEALLIYQIDKLGQGCLDEHLVDKQYANEVLLPNPAERIHTYTCSSMYEVVDVYYEHFDLLHGVKIFRRAYLSRK